MALHTLFQPIFSQTTNQLIIENEERVKVVISEKRIIIFKIILPFFTIQDLLFQFKSFFGTSFIRISPEKATLQKASPVKAKKSTVIRKQIQRYK